MRVTFGNSNGERSKGEIVKLSATRAKVLSLEPRQGHPERTSWNVPYMLLEMIGDEHDTKECERLPPSHKKDATDGKHYL